MHELEDICGILSVFHDGEVEDCSGDFEQLKLKIGCTYLAELVGKDNEYFFVTLISVNKFYFQEWLLPYESGGIRAITDFNEIADANAQLLRPVIEDDCIKYYCTHGALYLRCKAIEVYDQHHSLISPAQLFDLANRYWSAK